MLTKRKIRKLVNNPKSISTMKAEKKGFKISRRKEIINITIRGKIESMNIIKKTE